MAKEKEELNLEETNAKTKKVTNKKNTSKAVKAKEEPKVSTTKKSKTSTKTAKTTTKKTAKVDKKTTKVTKEVAKSDAKKSTKKASVKSDKKVTETKTKDSSEKVKEKKDNKVTPIAEKEKVKEETIIEKIKSFIAKIAAMQEEAKKESLEAKKGKKGVKKTEIEEKTSYLPEYYDLPYRYNETVVKILAQTPKRIFVYWDIADEDIIRYENAFGNDFFEKTYPVLLVHNDDKDYTMEIPINDFANSWYIDINDPKTKYTIQLGRKFKEIPKNIDISKIKEQKIILKTDYLPIAQSNKLEVPNNRILFTSLPRVIKFRNVKTYEEKEQLVSEIKTTYGNTYNIREFYKENYKEKIDEEIIGLNNPTSGGLSSSSFK